MKQPEMESSFDEFRRDRNQRRMQSGTPLRPIAKGQDVLREIEAAEARAVQDQRVTREVHDFFAEATRTAANIVQKVTEAQEQQSAVRARREVEEFLKDTIKRAQGFIQILQFETGPEAEKIVETQMHNLLGPLLDSFRHEGTAQLQDKHIGQNPFDIDVDAVSAEFRQANPAPAAETGDRPIEEHLVAELQREAEPAPEPEAAAPTAAPRAAHPLLQSLGDDPQKLKDALKALVRSGVLTREQAQDVYRAQLVAARQ